jgi:excisionase family DNA binding protein
MIIIQLDSEQLINLIKSSVRNVLEEKSISDQSQGDQFLTLKQTSLFLNLAPQTIYGFTSNQTIPFIKKGKKLYFKRSDLDNWLQEGRKKTKEEIIAGINLKEKGGKNG